MQQPARPAGTYLQHYPHTVETGVFAFHCEAIETGRPAQMEVNYQGDGLDNYFRLSAWRVGEGLLVSFDDTAQHSRTAVELALRESQARERAARAEAEQQRQQLHDLFMQAPACMARTAGPAHVFTMANPPFGQLFGGRPLLGLPLREALPEVQSQKFLAQLDRVYRTGETHYGTEEPAYLDRTNTGQLEAVYFNYIYQATRDTAGEVSGLLVFAYDVTAHVEARQQSLQNALRATAANEELAAANEELQAANEEIKASNNDLYIAQLTLHELNQELAAANEELQAANEEIKASNNDLYIAQLTLHELNQELEARVAERTEKLLRAQAEAERQRMQLERLFMQAPAAICILDGPELVYELANPAYRNLFPGRELLGRPLLAALPEIAGHEVYRDFRRVYETGVANEEYAMLVPFARPGDGVLEDRYFNFIQQARFGEDGQVDGILVFGFEVTEQVLARQHMARVNDELSAANQAVSARNDELAAANAQLIRTNQDLDNFVYVASHDLKQPVNNLAGLFDELRHAATFADADEADLLVPMVEEALYQLATTIDDLAAVGQAQRLPELPAETVDLEEITQEVLQTLQPQVLAARARITTDFAARPTISYARANLRTLLANLLSNSLKYNDPTRPCRVHISLWLENGRPVLLLEDNGLGFDAQRHRDELFHLFRRFHDHTEGTGVGLYLVNRIVQSNGGRVEVESEVGVGTTFRLYL
ncbi:PAS domain-containing protein [Hymenobacter sp. 5317J-9]|uniref:PAS domain-containing sensor histidine kinase n=1 Tax=Hymenobacter sp. 5317J-9 TaxID=2932250 RepID=UPI001FD6711C|nr:PAS domain-containing protein [Hymenobacter sp. 5317J-9]UOQ96434.1 PAS domain-containing protein [Hymenobacter sp. 5317J-9]